MKSVVFFNNKGGVGKTTLACNVGAALAGLLKQRVLLVDCDPQCNSTQLVVDEDTCSRLYWDADAKSATTVMSVLQPIQDGDASISKNATPLLGSKNRFGIDILPGHPRLSVVEDKLSLAWGETIAGDIGGIRKTNWCLYLCRELQDRYDVILFDVGPSLGSLNRTVLLGADYFVTPMGSDIFSIVGVRNIAEWLKQWLDLYDAGVLACERRHPKALEQYNLVRNLAIRRGFAGYTVQQYIAKSIKGERRPTLAFDQILQQMPTEMAGRLGEFAVDKIDAAALKLGDVPNMYSLVPLAQSAHAPILDLSGGDGIRGSGYKQVEKYAKIIDTVARALARNIGIGGKA
ncbi:MAG: ParA family protein [Deltaproteobacteria bacterium]|nr:ParA family protein [Deltaproteobacteria bacterium]